MEFIKTYHSLDPIVIEHLKDQETPRIPQYSGSTGILRVIPFYNTRKSTIYIHLAYESRSFPPRITYLKGPKTSISGPLYAFIDTARKITRIEKDITRELVVDSVANYRASDDIYNRGVRR